MFIPRDLIMMLLGIVIFVVVIGFYEIVFDYSKLKEEEKRIEEEKPLKKKGWIRRGWHNMIRDFKRGKNGSNNKKRNTSRRKQNKELHRDKAIQDKTND